MLILYLILENSKNILFAKIDAMSPSQATAASRVMNPTVRKRSWFFENRTWVSNNFSTVSHGSVQHGSTQK